MIFDETKIHNGVKLQLTYFIYNHF